MKAMVADLETENNEYYGDVASPYCPDNYIVEEAHEIVHFGKGDVKVEPRQWTRYESKEDFHAKYKGFDFDSCDIFVAHNAAYEMSWIMCYQMEDFINFIARGGRVYCTQLAHYLLSNQMDIYPALDDTAPLYGGTHKVDAVKAMWKAGYLTSQIDPDLLHEYLVGDCGDIANTTKVFLGTWSQLAERGMLKMALVRMDALVYSAFCKHFGLMIDREKASELLEENKTALAELNKEVLAMLPDDMPEDAVAQWNNTRFQLSALLFGGVMKYATQVPRFDKNGNEIMVKAEGAYFDSIKGARPLSECIFDEEAGGLWYHEPTKEHQARYKAGKNKGLPKFAKYETDEVDTKNGEKLYYFDGLVQGEVREKLKSEIEGAWVGKQTLADGSPVISTAGDVLDVLAVHGIEVAVALAKIAKIDKDLGSFYIKQKFNAKGELTKQSGMLQYVQDDDIIHHNILHCSTATSRLSCQKPNLQQLPRGDTSRVKEMFISRWRDDGVILQEDYSALETVGLQVFTRDTALKKALLSKTDMHSLRLAEMEELDYDYVIARTKDKTHPDHAVWDVKRTDIKPVAFQYQYGATAYGMAMSTGKSQEFCQAFIDAEKRAFPEVESWFDKLYSDVELSVTYNRPRRVQLDDGREFLISVGTWQSIEGTTYQFEQVTKSRWNYITKQREEVREFSVPQMRNYPIQGGSGFFVQLASGLWIRHLAKNNFYGMKCLPVNVVHDAMYSDCHKDVLYQAALEKEAIMECIPEVANSMWDFNIEVPFPVEGGAGSSMAIEEAVFTDACPKTQPDEFALAKGIYLDKKYQFKEAFLKEKGIQIQFKGDL